MGVMVEFRRGIVYLDGRAQWCFQNKEGGVIMAEQEIDIGARPPAPETSGYAVASLVLGIVGFVIGFLIPEVLAIVFGVKARRAIARSAGRLKGKGLALAGMILGIVHLALVPILISILIPALMGAQEQARRIQSASNLWQICRAAHAYVRVHEDRMPPNLDVLMPYFMDKEVFKNPRREEHDPNGDYAYVAGLGKVRRRELRSDDVIVYEKDDGLAESEGRNVGFADGRVLWMTQEEFEAALDKTRKWLVVVETFRE